MARHLRVEFCGAIYHVTCRMIGDRRLDQSRLFVDEKDRRRFLDCLADRVETYNIRLYLFVLMTNHFHLVFETPEANCSVFMQSLSTAYTVYYNRRHGRHGHLLDGRYKAKLVEGDDYLLSLSRYVHLNPVRVGVVKDEPIGKRILVLHSYLWSSYPSYIGKQKPFGFVEYGPILAQGGGKQSGRLRRYREFVETGLAKTDEDFNAALKMSPRSIGGESFRAHIDEFYQKKLEGHSRPEDVSFRRVTEPLAAEQILKTLAEVFEVGEDAFRERRRNSALRAVAVRMLVRFGGQTQREAAMQLAMGTGGAASAQVRKLPDSLSRDRSLRRRVQLIEEKLERIKKDRRAEDSRHRA